MGVADLLFVDPVGTGFSRPLTEGGGKRYWSPAGDAEAVITLVRDWLARTGRTAAPLFIAGESYGGYRLGMMAEAATDLNVAGLILISPALDMGGSADQRAIEQLPTLGVAAWHHRKAGKPDESVAQVWDRARTFAQGDYAVALQRGWALPDSDRERIADQVAALTGMPRDAVLKANLRLDSQAFLETLLPGRVVGRLDTRVSAPAPAAGEGTNRPAAANDPSLGLGRTNVIVSQPIGDYLRQEVGVKTEREYYSLTLDVNFSWDWQPPSPGRPGADWNVTDRIATLMAKKPGARLLLVGGYYDLATPLLGPQYAITHSRIAPDRVTMLALPTGHSPFEDRADAARRVAAFVAQPR